jgi:hypothetical protein
MRTTHLSSDSPHQKVHEVRRKIMPVVKVIMAVLAQTYMGAFFFRSVSDTIFAVLFLLKLPQTTV